MVASAHPGTPVDHAVSFYDADSELVDELAEFVAAGLELGDSVLVVATPQHRRALALAAARRDVDLTAAAAAGRYIAIDAAAALATFMADGRPHKGRFEVTVGALLDRAEAGGRSVRVFGEMVALLWADEQLAAAIELESLWNSLRKRREFSLLCAYATADVAGAAELASLRAVCQRHSAVAPPNSYLADTPVVGRSDGRAGLAEVFVPVPAAIRAVRRFVSSTLIEWGDSALVDDAVLVVSELATNSVRHGQSPFRVSLRRSGRTIRIAVEDVAAGVPVQRPVTEDALGGRGVALVATVSTHWGYDASGPTKVVWAEFDTAPRRAAG